MFSKFATVGRMLRDEESTNWVEFPSSQTEAIPAFTPTLNGFPLAAHLVIRNHTDITESMPCPNFLASSLLMGNKKEAALAQTEELILRLRLQQARKRSSVSDQGPPTLPSAMLVHTKSGHALLRK